MKFALPLKLHFPLLVCLFIIGTFSRVTAQEIPPAIDITKIILDSSIESKCLYFESQSRSVAPQDLPSLPFKATPPSNIRKRLTSRQRDHDWYLEFRLHNASDTAIEVYFSPGMYLTRIDLYHYNEATGKTEPLPAIMPHIKDSIGYRKIIVGPHKTATYFAHLTFVKTNINRIEPRIIRSYFLLAYDENYKIPQNNANIYTYIIVGILMMMIFYSMAVFILNGTLEFLYYSCFALLMGVLFFLKSYYFQTPIFFNHYFESYLDFVIQSMGTFFYLIFLRKFIDAKKNFPFLHKLFVTGQIIVIISIVLFSILNFSTDNFYWQDKVENFTKYQWLLTTVIFIVYAFAHKNKMLNYLAVGHSLYLLAGIGSLVLITFPNLLNIQESSIWKDALFYYELGLTVELIFFLMALAFKNRRDIIDRTRERERLKLENERKEFEKHLAIVEAKQEERNRISTDMHDELGSGVTAIRLMSEIVKTKMKDSTLPEIEKISQNANELLSKMNTIIWTMSSTNDKLDNMVAYIRAYAFEFFENTNITCHFENQDYIPSTDMSGEKRRNLFLCIKEALNNVAKHSKGQDVWITILITGGKLDVKIHDNGVGINLEKLREFGNGLNNMRKRMQNIEGAFYVENKQGTTTIFTVPL